MNGTTPLRIILMKMLEAERPGDLQHYLERNSEGVGERSDASWSTPEPSLCKTPLEDEPEESFFDHLLWRNEIKNL